MEANTLAHTRTRIEVNTHLLTIEQEWKRTHTCTHLNKNGSEQALAHTRTRMEVNTLAHTRTRIEVNTHLHSHAQEANTHLHAHEQEWK